jgi:hypothetical protein
MKGGRIGGVYVYISGKGEIINAYKILVVIPLENMTYNCKQETGARLILWRIDLLLGGDSVTIGRC